MIENIVAVIMGFVLIIAGICIGTDYYIPGGFLFLAGLGMLMWGIVI
jgi:hypothetical protein